VLFTYLHLAPIPVLTEKLLQKKVVGIAYETIRDRAGTLPLLTPMSEVAGRMAVQVGAAYLEKEKGGRGVLLGGVPGVPPASVCVIGGGIVGTNAAKIALGMGAQSHAGGREPEPAARARRHFQRRIFTLASNSWNIRAPCRKPIWSSAAC
jgi:alanine dehydrogenase